jgi:hypothetical protein
LDLKCLEGFDPVYGARPLRRLIQRSIENPIAIYLIQKTIVTGDTILVDYDPAQDKYLFSKAKRAAPDPSVGQSDQHGVVEGQEGQAAQGSVNQGTGNPADQNGMGNLEGQNPTGQNPQAPVTNGTNGQAPVQGQPGQGGALPGWLNNVTEAAQGGAPDPNSVPATTDPNAPAPSQPPVQT